MELVGRIAPRRVSAEEGDAAIAEFAASLDAAPDKDRLLTLAFSGLLEVTNRDRADLIIARLIELGQRQHDLADIASKPARSCAHYPRRHATGEESARRSDLEQRFTFVTQAFESTQRTMRYACETPVAPRRPSRPLRAGAQGASLRGEARRQQGTLGTYHLPAGKRYLKQALQQAIYVRASARLDLAIPIQQSAGQFQQDHRSAALWRRCGELLEIGDGCPASSPRAGGSARASGSQTLPGMSIRDRGVPMAALRQRRRQTVRRRQDVDEGSGASLPDPVRLVRNQGRRPATSRRGRRTVSRRAGECRGSGKVGHHRGRGWAAR